MVPSAVEMSEVSATTDPTDGGYRLGSPSGWFGISSASVDSDAPVIDNHARAA